VGAAAWGSRPHGRCVPGGAVQGVVRRVRFGCGAEYPGVRFGCGAEYPGVRFGCGAERPREAVQVWSGKGRPVTTAATVVPRGKAPSSASATRAYSSLATYRRSTGTPCRAVKSSAKVCSAGVVRA